MIIYIFIQMRKLNGTPLGYGMYTVVIVAANEAEAWEILLQGHPSEKQQWDFVTYPVDQPGEVTVCIE